MKTLLFFWCVKRNSIILKIFILIFFWCLTWWPLSTNFSHFVFLFVCVWESVHSYPLLLYSLIFGLPLLLFKLQHHCINLSVQDESIQFYWLLRIYYRKYCLRQHRWCIGWIWNLIPTPMCKSYVCHIYRVSIFNGL